LTIGRAPFALVLYCRLAGCRFLSAYSVLLIWSAVGGFEFKLSTGLINLPMSQMC